MASSKLSSTPRKHTFDARVSSFRSPKSDINALILDYLTMEGYPDAAANFIKEANLQPQQEDSFIHDRQQIQNAIHQGCIDEAITDLNELDPEILDRDPSLHFALLRLQLVEMIRAADGGDIMPAMNFAREQLGPRAPTSSAFLEDLEETMSLLFYPRDKLPAQVKKLLQPELRRLVADKVNEAILQQHSQRRESSIRHLVKMRAWAEQAARDSGKNIPTDIDLGFRGEDNDAMDESALENGHDVMITT